MSNVRKRLFEAVDKNKNPEPVADRHQVRISLLWWGMVDSKRRQRRFARDWMGWFESTDKENAPSGSDEAFLGGSRYCKFHALQCAEFGIPMD